MIRYMYKIWARTMIIINPLENKDNAGNAHKWYDLALGRTLFAKGDT